MTVSLAVGLTTCMRQGFSYVADTLESLAAAGFEPTVFNDEKRDLGAYGASKHALRSLLDAQPDADGYLIFQDDIIAAKNLAAYLDAVLWPDDVAKIGAISLFTPMPRAVEGATGFERCDFSEDRLTTGGLGLILPKHAAETLLRDPPRPGSRHGWDLSVAEMCIREGLDWWYHHPSLLKHTGEISSIAVWPTNWPPRQCKELVEDAGGLIV